MRYIPNDKYTIAWFKLAECVTKGEKEKAFGVYRLLKHSFEDQAYAHQLEGDLLHAFGDERAKEKYEHAAQLYQHNNRLKEAAAIYEELAFLFPENDRYISKIIDLYKKHKNAESARAKLLKIAALFAEKKLYKQSFLIVASLEDECDDSLLPLYTQIILGFIHDNADEAVIENVLKRAIAVMVSNDYQMQLQQLLGALEQVNHAWYQRALKYLAEQ